MSCKQVIDHTYKPSYKQNNLHFIDAQDPFLHCDNLTNEVISFLAKTTTLKVQHQRNKCKQRSVLLYTKQIWLFEGFQQY